MSDHPTMPLVWLDGQVLDATTARIGALDHGLTVGDGVFETCTVIDGRPFALTRHLRRLARSASVLALPDPDPEQIRAGVQALCGAAGPLPRGRLRITMTGGVGPLGSARGGASPTLLLALSPSAPWPELIEVASAPWTRNERSPVAGAKTTSYAENVVALQYAQARGAHEALLPNTLGMLCEGTGSNVVIDLGDGTLSTPPLSSGCLAGITRELLLEWAGDEGLPLVERDISMSGLLEAHDVLLTSSTRGVQQVQVVDGRDVSGGELGRAAVELFGRRAAERIDP
jgi:branched-chain amino acid aminotransferase